MLVDGNSEDAQIEQLVSRAAAGDRAAQQQVLKKFWPVIQAAVRARLSEAVRSVGPDDITQQAAVRLLERLPTFRGSSGSAFGAWVRAIAESVIVDSLRRERAMKRGRRDTGPLEREPPAPQTRSDESLFDALRRQERFVSAVNELGDAERISISLQRSGYTYVEMGNILGCTTDAVRKRVSRAVGKLRLALANRSPR